MPAPTALVRKPEEVVEDAGSIELPQSPGKYLESINALLIYTFAR
jgi:hypothetical protein